MAREYLIYKLRVELADVEPPIWRVIYVDADITLRKLHHVLQVAFGWESRHAHAFKISRVTYRDLPQEALPPGPADKLASDKKIKLSEVTRERTRFTYDYGGDMEWRHQVRVQKILVDDERLEHAILDSGQLNGPTEHCHGPRDYSEQLADYIANPRVPKPGDALADTFIHGRFDPLYVDRRGINTALARLANNGGGK